MVGLVDANNFYVSAERIFDLSLRNRPGAVLSNNDGCVVSRSDEFKALNLPRGIPFFKLKDLVRDKGVVVRSSNYELYGDISRRILATLNEFSPDVEPYSIDEAFLHVSRPDVADFHAFGKAIRETVLRWVGVPCGVGFAPTRTLAKIANHIGKKLPDGVFVMPDNPAGVLEGVPVEEVWGIGRRVAPKLAARGYRTAADLALADVEWAKRQFSVTLARTILELRGENAIAADPPPDAAAGISVSRSYGHPVTSLADIEESVAHYTARACEKLRRLERVASGITVFLQHYMGVSAESGWGFRSAAVTFPSATSSTSAMQNALLPHVKGLFVPGFRYRKAGVLLFGLESAHLRQLELFDDHAESARQERLSSAMDIINQRFGRGTLHALSEGVERQWSMRRENLSPAYTTRWNDIPTVR